MATTRDDAADHQGFCDVVLAGKENVGKTSIYKRLENNTFQEGASTIGVDSFDRKYTLISGAEVHARLWDTAGAERYRAMTRSYYKYAKAVVFVYSTDDPTSLADLNINWVEDASAYAPKDALWVFVCNKTDLSGDEVRLSDADEAAFFENQLPILKEKDHDSRPPPLRWRMSAKTGQNVNEGLEEVLQRITDCAASRTGEGQSSNHGNPLTPPVRLDSPPPKKQGCCR